MSSSECTFIKTGVALAAGIDVRIYSTLIAIEFNPCIDDAFEFVSESEELEPFLAS